MYRIELTFWMKGRPDQSDVREALKGLGELKNGGQFMFQYSSICPVCGKMPLGNAIVIDGDEYHQKCSKEKKRDDEKV